MIPLMKGIPWWKTCLSSNDFQFPSLGLPVKVKEELEFVKVKVTPLDDSFMWKWNLWKWKWYRWILAFHDTIDERYSLMENLPVLERFPIPLPGAPGLGLQQAFEELPGRRQINIGQISTKAPCEKRDINIWNEIQLRRKKNKSMWAGYLQASRELKNNPKSDQQKMQTCVKVSWIYRVARESSQKQTNKKQKQSKP